MSYALEFFNALQHTHTRAERERERDLCELGTLCTVCDDCRKTGSLTNEPAQATSMAHGNR